MKIFKPVLIAGLCCLSLAGNLYADDSTNITGPNVTTVMPEAKVNLNDCVLSSRITAFVAGGSGGTGKPLTSNCPTGYVASGMKVFVGLGVSTGRYYWQTNCCKSYIEYPNTPSS